MTFADIHMHALWGVDDGAKTESEMLAILDAAYTDGTRFICLTPHFYPGHIGDNSERSREVFASLQAYLPERYPGLVLLPGNELRYSDGCLYWLEAGHCRCLGNTNYVLVDFHTEESGNVIAHGLNRLLNAGYIPILAHAERYCKLSKALLEKCRSNGVLVQVDSQSLFGQFGVRAKWTAKTLLREHMVDFLASDAHDCHARPPELSGAYGYVVRKYGTRYAEKLCQGNARELLWNDSARKDVGDSYGK